MGGQGALDERGRVPFERAGVDAIDEELRTSTPWTFFAIFVGGSVALGSVIYGWLPILYGLGFWQAITSIVAGTLVGLVVILPLIVIGSRTATNNSTSSGAHFGVHGRLVGSLIGLAIMVTSTAIVVWTGGLATVWVANRLFDTSTSNVVLGLAYAGVVGVAVLVAVYGYHLLVYVTRVLMVAGGALVLLMLVAFAGDLDPSYEGVGYMLGGFWETWLLSAITVGVGGVLQVSTILGDWTRYISPRRYPAGKLLPVAALAVAISYIVPPAIGTLVATAFTDPFAPFPMSLASEAPGWYAVLLLPLALFGGVGFAATTLYSGGLDLHTAVPRLSRAQATVAISVVSVALVYLGSFVWEAFDAITAASLVLLAVIAPWAAIVGIGFLRSRGEYRLDDLQVGNRGERGGAYWFTRGWNWRALVAWAGGSIFGVLAVQSRAYTGPLADIADHVDVSFVGSFTIAGVL